MRFTQSELKWLEDLVSSAIVRRDDEINDRSTDAAHQRAAMREKAELNKILAKVQARMKR